MNAGPDNFADNGFRKSVLRNLSRLERPSEQTPTLTPKADIHQPDRHVRQGPKADPILSAQALLRGGQGSLIGFHDAALPFACAHLVGCDAVLIVRNGAFEVAARVLVRPLCRACAEHACACYNRRRHCKTNSHHWSLGHTTCRRIISLFWGDGQTSPAECARAAGRRSSR